MKRLLISMTSAAMAVTVLGACGGESSDSSADKPAESTSPSPSKPAPESPGAAAPSGPGADTKYCQLLGTDFASLFGSIKGPEDVTKAINVVRDIADEAPKEVSTDWKTMEGAFGELEGALKQAATLQQQAQQGEINQKQLQQKSQELQKSMKTLDTPENKKAGDAVSTHAQEYCGVSLG